MVLTDPLSLTFAALADPTRRAILARLAEGEATVNELAEPFGVTLQAVSRHVQVLEHAGLVAKGKSAQTRPCRLETAPLQPAIDWIEQQRDLWEQRFDQLQHHLRTIQATNERTSQRSEKGKRKQP
jgi:DNA-binding transcriptional ArsR family regulator